ncbi:MAG: hypothetical protein WKG00_09285 [Polyangiaceae bacterium]
MDPVVLARRRIVRHVRALAPSPGAVTEVAGRIVTVLAARAATTWPAALEQGEGAIVDGRALVRCADGAVELVDAQVEPYAAGDAGVEAPLGDLASAEAPPGDPAAVEAPPTLLALFLAG